MPQKIIPNLQPRSEVTDGVNFPIDDGVQSYRVSGAQVKNYVMPDGSVDFAKLASEVIASITPPGVIAPYIAETAPSGWLNCNGAPVSRSTYATLFALIGTNFGNGDGSTTFNLPDFRGRFLRGKVGIPNVTGSGTAASNNATFTAHGYTRKGTKVRKASGTLSGLSADTDYYLIIIDENTLAFATSYANALADTKIVLSGSNSAVIAQWEDPDASTRIASAPGGATGDVLGSLQEDAFQGHAHEGYGAGLVSGNGTNLAGTAAYNSPINGILNPKNYSPYGNVRVSSETRSKNILVNYIIKT